MESIYTPHLDGVLSSVHVIENEAALGGISSLYRLLIAESNLYVDYFSYVKTHCSFSLSIYHPISTAGKQLIVIFSGALQKSIDETISRTPGCTTKTWSIITPFSVIVFNDPMTLLFTALVEHGSLKIMFS